MPRLAARAARPTGSRIKRLIGRIERWHRVSVRRRILVAMLAVSVIPLAIFSLAGLAALYGLNNGALTTANAKLEASEGAHLSDLVHSKAQVINNELESVQDEVALLSQATGAMLSQQPSNPPPRSEVSGISLYGSGVHAARPSSQVLALESMGSQLSLIYNLHPEVADVWIELPQTGQIAVAPTSALASAHRGLLQRALPTSRNLPSRGGPRGVRPCKPSMEAPPAPVGPDGRLDSGL